MRRKPTIVRDLCLFISGLISFFIELQRPDTLEAESIFNTMAGVYFIIYLFYCYSK
jgi:hypothetical protein